MQLRRGTKVQNLVLRKQDEDEIQSRQLADSLMQPRNTPVLHRTRRLLLAREFVQHTEQDNECGEEGRLAQAVEVELAHALEPEQLRGGVRREAERGVAALLDEDRLLVREGVEAVLAVVGCAGSAAAAAERASARRRP